ncbi:response regulator transcription factor [uncultured Robinsoniella sp.]|uniref:response regulator transcription factor n=1 Tax=uncultured Robinsoniella sp. TaxID=904190 RepID=UPI00374E7786
MRILIIDDDVKLCQSLSYKLKKEGFSVDICHNGEDGLYLAFQNAHDLILLDRMLPSMSGTMLLSQLRESGSTTPVILVTALGEIHDRVQGLDTGADDYLVKPIAYEELMARIRCISRRPRKIEIMQHITCGDVTLHTLEKVLYKDSLSCSLSKKEGELMEVFLKNPNRVLPRMLLLVKVWGPDAEIEDGNLDNYIHFLRRRLRTVDSLLTIKTIRGIGYRLEV